MSVTALHVLLVSGQIYVMLGLAGSLIESVGNATASPRLVRVGKAIEAIAADAPKLIANLKGPK